VTAQKVDNQLGKRLAEAKEAADKWPEWKREAMKAQVTLGPSPLSESPGKQQKRMSPAGEVLDPKRARSVTGER
jgi:hypothetical protein